MKSLRLSLSALVAAVGLLGSGVAYAQFPDPADEAKLYELAKKEGTLIWYGSAAQEIMKTNADDFMAKYPGINVEILRVVGVAQYQRFLRETEAKQHIADLVHISDYPSQRALGEAGHLADWKVPSSNRIGPAYKLGDHSYAPAITTLAIAYNVNKVKPEEVALLESSWKAVLDPRFKGRFASPAIKASATYAGVHMFLDPANSQTFGRDFIKALAAQNPTPYPSTVTVLERVVVGEHDFSYWTFDSINYVEWLKGAPIRWFYPSPTPALANSWYAVSKYAPHPNAARLFLNWIMSPDGAASLQRTGHSTVIEGVPDTRKMTTESWYKAPRELYLGDWARWEKNFNEDMDFWIETISKKK